MGHKCEGLHCGGCNRRHSPRLSGRGLAVAVVAVVVVLAAGGEAVARSRAVFVAVTVAIAIVVVLILLAMLGGLVVVLVRAGSRREIAAKLTDSWQESADQEHTAEVPAWPERPALPSARPVLPGWLDDGAEDDARPVEWWQRGGWS